MPRNSQQLELSYYLPLIHGVTPGVEDLQSTVLVYAISWSVLYLIHMGQLWILLYTTKPKPIRLHQFARICGSLAWNRLNLDQFITHSHAQIWNMSWLTLDKKTLRPRNEWSIWLAQPCNLETTLPVSRAGKTAWLRGGDMDRPTDINTLEAIERYWKDTPRALRNPIPWWKHKPQASSNFKTNHIVPLRVPWASRDTSPRIWNLN